MFAQETLHRCDEHLRIRRLGNQQGIAARAVDFAIPAMNYERHAALFEPLAEACTVAIAERMVEHCGGNIVLLHQRQRLSKHGGADNAGARVLERLLDVDRDKGLVLDNEDKAAGEKRIHGKSSIHEKIVSFRKAAVSTGSVS
jgi:hypothetical protein